MGYDQGLAQRIRELIEERPDYIEKEMFGGIGFMLGGNMACGVIGEEMVVRVGPEGYEEAVKQPEARVFDFTGRPMKGWVMVAAKGLEVDADLKQWVQRGVDFALSLPAK